MSVDFRTLKSRIGNPTGGLSGRAIRPITMRLVYEVARAVRIPIVALGGIDSAEDVLEYFVVGAASVQIGTATFADPRACGNLVVALERLCMSSKISKISNLTGTFRGEKA